MRKILIEQEDLKEELNFFNTKFLFQSPCGQLLLVAYGGKLCMCDWIGSKRLISNIKRLHRFITSDRVPTGYSGMTEESNANIDYENHESADNSVINAAIKELKEYFAHRRTEFDIPLLLSGTDFQNKVRSFLQEIPYGETLSYRSVASAIGLPHGIRAVASAIAANPLSIFLPCHRVIASDGSLGGYAGGMCAKKYLLNLEANG